MNMGADILATEARQYALEVTLLRPVYSFTGILIDKETSTQITDLREYLLQKRHRQQLIDYMSKKNEWNTMIPNIIDWTGLNNFLKKIGTLKRLKILQLMHDWQNIGEQKRKFNMARDNTAKSTLPPITQTQQDEEKCQANCGEKEDTLHYMQCTENRMRQERNQLLQQCRNT